jgi:hypothetical protein
VLAAGTGTNYGQAMTAGDTYTIAADGTPAYSGEGGPATAAGMSPLAVATDAAGGPVHSRADRSVFRVHHRCIRRSGYRMSSPVTARPR